MADKLGLNCDVRELKLGASFSNNKASQYHTIKYDFKPASVDVNKMASVDVGTNSQVTVTVPHLDGAGVPQTVFKGNQRPYTKECVLIIDRVTGEVTLERLSSNIQVKKTRQESAQKPRPETPIMAELTNTTQRSSSRTRVTSGRRQPVIPVGQPQPSVAAQARYGAAQKTPPTLMRSPPRMRTSPPQATPWAAGGQSTMASLPMIGLDEAPPPAVHNGYVPAPPQPPSLEAYMAPAPARPPERPAPPPRPAPVPLETNNVLHAPQAEQSSSSSSSDSSADSDSGSDSDDEEHRSAPRQPLSNGQAPGPVNPALPSDVLNHDLCLSDSGSD